MGVRCKNLVRSAANFMKQTQKVDDIFRTENSGGIRINYFQGCPCRGRSRISGKGVRM